jgi:transcriptional regulator GlxA family with amidase domain
LVTGGSDATAAATALADVPTSTLAEIVRASMDELQRRLRAETGTNPARFSPREGTPPL